MALDSARMPGARCQDTRSYFMDGLEFLFSQVIGDWTRSISLPRIMYPNKQKLNEVLMIKSAILRLPPARSLFASMKSLFRFGCCASALTNDCYKFCLHTFGEANVYLRHISNFKFIPSLDEPNKRVGELNISQFAWKYRNRMICWCHE